MWFANQREKQTLSALFHFLVRGTESEYSREKSCCGYNNSNKQNQTQRQRRGCQILRSDWEEAFKLPYLHWHTPRKASCVWLGLISSLTEVNRTEPGHVWYHTVNLVLVGFIWCSPESRLWFHTCHNEPPDVGGQTYQCSSEPNQMGVLWKSHNKSCTSLHIVVYDAHDFWWTTMRQS